MAGLDPAIHVFSFCSDKQDVDARVKPGHDGVENSKLAIGAFLSHLI
ncbi:MAG: ABC transporter [Pseudomonadota bacterium]